MQIESTSKLNVSGNHRFLSMIPLLKSKFILGDKFWVKIMCPLIFTVFLVLVQSSANAQWTQPIGDGVVGESTFNGFGTNVVLSSNENVLAVASPRFKNTEGSSLDFFGFDVAIDDRELLVGTDSNQEPGGPQSTNSSVYVVDQVESTADVFQDAIIAASGSVTYQANTNITGVLSFDKAQDYWVDLNALQDDLNGTSRSVFMWVKVEDDVAGDNQVLFAINEANGDNRSFLFIDNSGDNLEVNRGGINTQSADYNMGDEQWHYVGYTYDASTNETVIYVDGIENSRASRSQLAVADDQYSLGQEFDGKNDSDHFNGDMAEVSVWNDVLTGGEIREAMKTKITDSHPKYANLVGYYSIFGAYSEDATVLKDHSGKGNDGVMQNGLQVDFKNVQAIEGFNAIDWYTNLSWSKDGSEVSTDAAYTTDVAEGTYTFTATRDFIKATDSWTMTLNSNAATVDEIADETLCADDPITRTVNTNTVNYLDFEEDDENFIDVSEVVDDLVGSNRSIFMWVNKESNVANNDSDVLFSIHTDNGTESVSNLYIKDNERLAIYNGSGNDQGTTSLGNDTWYFVGYTYDATTFETKIYVNGQLENTFTEEMPVIAGGTAFIGMEMDDEGPSDFLDGKLAEVTVWDKVLTQEEVTVLMGAASANNVTNLVASYGTLKNIADNRLFDLSANGNDGLASHETIIVTTEEATLADYDASINYSFSWKKDAAEFDTDAKVNIAIAEGTTNYSVNYGTPFFQKTDVFALSYTNLLPNQPTSKSAGVTGKVTFEVDDISGASYQWYQKGELNGITRLRSTFPSTKYVRDIVYTENKLFVAVEGGLYFSEDLGASWLQVPPNTNGFPAGAFVQSLFYDNGKLYVGTNDGLFKSEDQGLNWETIASGSDITGGTPVAIYASGDNISVTTSSSSGGISISNDGGNTWLKTVSATNTIGFWSAQNLKSLGLIGDNVFVGSGSTTGLAVSRDGGASWSVLGEPEGVFGKVLGMDVDGMHIYLATDLGLHISEDAGLTWAKGPGILEDAWLLDVVVEGDRLFAIENTNFIISDSDGGNATRYSNSSIGTNGGFLMLDASQDNFFIGPSENSTQLVSIVNDIVALQDQTDNTALNQIQGATTHQLTINNLSLDQNQSEYYVVVSKDGCEQISNQITLTVLDVPGIESISPAASSSDVAIDVPVVITFNRDITKGSGNIRIVDHATDSEIQSFSVDQTDLSGRILTLPSASLANDTRYYITIDEGIVLDISSNKNLAVTDKEKYSFTTVCEPLVLTQPADQIGAVTGSATFSVPEVTGASYQWFQEGGIGEIDEPITNMPAPSDATRIVRAMSSSNSRLFVVFWSGGFSNSTSVLSYSENEGATWTEVVGGENGFSSQEVSDVYADGNKIYVGHKALGHFNGKLSISEDGGNSWEIIEYTDTNGFTRGSINAVFAIGNKLFVGEGNTGLLISEDGGENWRTVAAGENGTLSTNIQSIYAEGNNVYVVAEGGLSISTDGGTNWTSDSNQNGLGGGPIFSKVFVDGNNVYVGAGSGFNISNDGGNTWRKLSTSEMGFATSSSVKGIYADGDKIYVGVFNENGGLTVSEDGGQTWTTFSTTGENQLTLSNEVLSMTEHQGSVYIGVRGGIEVLVPKTKLTNVTDQSSANQITGADSRELTINNLTLDLDQSQFSVVVTKGNCEETSDLATLTVAEAPVLASFTPALNATDVALDTDITLTFNLPVTKGTGSIRIKKADDDTEVAAFAVTSQSVSLTDKTLTVSLGATTLDYATTYYVTLDADVVKDGSDQGNPAVIDKTAISFTTVCPNLITEQPTSQSSTVGGSATFSVPEVDGASYQWYQSGAGEFVSTNGGYGAFSVSVVGESVYAAISGAGLQISKDGGATWSFTKSGDNGFASSDLVGTVYAENNTVYAGTYGGGLSISSDGGLNWTTHLISKLGLQSSTINSVFAEGNIVYAGTSEGVSISNDGGVFWTTTTNGENGFALSGNVNTVYAKNDVIYAGTAMGISISTDGGATWSTTTNGQNGFASSDKVNSVFAAGNKVYAGTSGGISISNDGGVSWTTTTSGQNGFALSDKVNSVFATGQKVYAGTDKGLSVSTDGGASWSTTTAGQNGFPAIDQILAVNEINGTLYIGSRGLYTQEMYSLLENVSDESSTNQITGVDTRELTVNNLMTDFDQSKFFVVVSKGNCEETSELATLTVTVQGPDILMVSPANGVSNLFPSSLNTVSSSSNKFTLTLTENIKYGNVDAEYKLYTADNDELVASQSLISTQTGPLVNSPRATFGFYDYSFEYGKSYYILIDAGMLKSDATDADFAGITDKTVWAFSTISDETRPTINTLSPAAGATNVSIADISITQDELNTATSTDDTDQFTIVFNERITFGANSTTTTFKLYKAEGDELLSEQTTFDLALRGPNIKSSDPNTFIFRFVDVVFEPATEYYIQIDEGAVVNFDTTLPFAGISDKTTWSFTTEVAEAETFEFTGTFPADDQTDVPLGISTTDPFVGTGFEGFFTGHIISFENKIKSGVAGKISLYKASDNSLVHEINTANDPIIIQENINSTVGEVYIGGFGETGLMINADITLEPQREYYWLIDQGIVEYSESSAVFAGISDPTVWNFTTGIGENTEGITIVSQTPENNATDVSINPVLEFTFKTGTVQEDLITANTGSIKIKKVSDDTEAAVVDVTSDKVRVSFEVTTTYITNVSVSFEDASLEPNTEYYVEISPEAFKDQKGGFYSGISDKTTWSFTTGQAQNTEGHFITTWETTGASEAISITLGNTSGATFQPHNYSIDWGDGSEVETGVSADVSHTYAEPGIHTVKISGEFYQISLGSDLNNAKKLRTIEQWGAIVWKDLSRAFEGCENLVINANDQPNLSEVTSLVYTFKNATNFNADLSGWDVSNVTKMSGMFDGASAFNQDLSSWDVSAVRDMGDMFSGATSFNGDVSTWDVSSVGSMANMFKGASAFNQELSSWDVSSVRDMLYMFSDATSFTSDLSDWDVSSVTQIIGMFNKAAAFNSDLSAWNISSSITSTSYMFGGATNFSSNLSGWDMSSVTDLSYMFYSASSFNGDLSGWDVSSVSDMNFVFWDATSFKSDLSTWDVSSATRMSAMFMGASVFTSDLSSWDVSSVIFMSNMFEGASVFNSDLSGWEVSSVTSMSNMFDRASMFTSDLSGWDVSLVTSMGSMFEGASMFNSDLSGWDVSRVTNMGSMFKGASMFTSDLSSWDVSLVTNMSSMFEGASLFTSDLSSWDVSSVSLMNSMFEGASSFNSDLSSWNLVSVKTIENMLKGAAISVVNYDAILRGWGANSLTPTRLRFGEVSSSYCDADASNFFRRKRWIYTDQGQDCLELVTLLPANNAAGVLVQPEISITFDEVIVKGTGDIILYNTLDDSEVVRISVESTLVGVDGTTTTIRLGDLNLDFGTSYYFLVPETAFKNEADLYFQGITDKTTWSFTTAEENVGLSISSLIPTNGSIDVSLSAVNSAFPGNNRFWITFNEGVKNGNTSAEYRLYKADNDELVASQTFISTQSGPSFNNTSTGLGFYNYSFEKGTSYYILMDAGMFKSISSDEEFAGITDKNVWSFTTEAEPLLVKSTDPNSDEAVNLDDAFITINFDEEIAIGVGAFTIYRALDNSVFETIDVSNFNIINNGITGFANVDLSQNWEIGVDYYVQYPNGLFTSLDGAKKIKAVIDKISYTIQAERFAESIFTAFYPANGSVNYKVDSGDDFVISLSEDVYGNGRPPIGALRIYKAANDELIKTFQLRGDFQQGENEGDLNDYDDNDNIEDKIYISVGDVLEPSTEYYILIDDGFVISYDEELYHLGISDKNTWRFTTLDLPSTPVLSATTPVNNASDVATNTALILEFSENMVASQGNINVYAANGNLLETKEAIAATTSGAKVTIRLTNELSNSETYYVLIDADAFESTNGVAFAGISDDQVFRFTTAAAGNKVPTVSNQNFTGRLEVNQQLTGSYTYTDADSDPESGTTLQWYVADNAAGANKAPVSGANAINYTLTTSEVGKFLALGITPNDGKDAGTEAFTDYQGPVLAAVIPTLVSTVPADGALDVAVDANLTLTLSETVTKGTGNIVLTPTSGTATQVAVTSSDVSISGAVVTINPTADLLEGQFYTVTFDATAFVDADGNNSAGLSSQTTWNFTTKEANVAPVATGVTLKKSLVVDGVLEGSYTYTDANGDVEAGTTFKWYRADDVNGTNKAEITGATTGSYTIVNGDNGKFISFEVTPNDGALSGTPSESVFFGPILINDGNTNIPPAFTSDALTSIKDNENYSYTITYEDLNSDVPVLTKTTGPAWLSVSGFVLSGSPTASNIGDHQVVLTLDDQKGGTVTQAFTVTVIQSNTAPSVSGVELAGTTTIDQVLTGSYNFIDAEQDTDNSTFKWYRSDDTSGSNKAEINSATSTTYTLTTADADKYISFEVTPNDGTINGTTGESALLGPIGKKTPSLSLAGITKVYGDAAFDLSATTNSSGTVTYSFDNDQTGANLSDVRVTLGNVGQITVNVSLAADAEYAARTVQGTITVSKRPITFAAQNASKVYGAADPSFFSFDVTQGNLVSDAEVIRLSRDAGEAVGTYSINLSEGEGAENYDITTVSGTFTITKVPITVTAVAATKVYGDTDPTFTFNITSGALITGDELSGAITRVVGNNVGTYALESSLFNGNYDITFVSTDLTITKKALTATADDKTKNVGEANPELTITYEGFVLGDNASVLDAAPSINTDALLDSPAGVYDITLSEGSDNNYELTLVNGKFTVNAVNNPPTVANAITDKTEDEGFTSNTVDLSNVFADADSDALTYTAISSTEGVATVAVSGTTLTYTEVAVGTTTITVTANDGKDGTVSDDFTVTINAAPVNNAPTLANAITDKTEDEGFTSNTVDLSNVFADADSDALTYTAISSTESVATVAVSGTTLTYTEVSVGTTTITVTANDGKGGTVSDEFTVTINAAPVNNAPTVANAITDKTEDEGFASNTVDLSNVFADADSDALTYTASSSTEGVATVAVSGTTLTYSEVSIGTTTITVTANDGKGGTVSDEFTVTINAAPVNNLPTVANAITDKTENEGFTSNTVDLTTVFTDADSDVLTYTASSSTESVATVAVFGTTLTYSEVSVGTTTITVTANDGKGGTVSDDFTVTINAAPVNNAPTVASAITNKTEDEGFTSNTVDLSTVFTDSDSDVLTYTASSSTEGVATVAVSGTTLTYTEVAVGTTTITVTANDGKGGTVSDEFTVTINAAPVNNAPTVANAITDKTEDEGFASNTVDLTNVFADADSDALTYTASSSTEGVATVAVSGTTLTYSEVSIGTTTITVTANDGKGGTVTDDFTVTINAAPVNNPPTVANAIADITEDEGFTSNTVDLTNVFSDADSDALTYTASSSTEGVATVAVSGTTLTYSEVSIGTTTITVTANDGKGGTVTDDFTVTINAAPVNNPPTVANAIADIIEDEGFTSNTVDLTNVFSDADSDALTYTASSSTEGVATVTLSGTTLTYSEVSVGTTTITVTANDGKGGTVSDEFTVTINAAPVNNAPTVASAITDKTENAGFASNTVDLSNVFADADSDALTYTASSAEAGIATVSVAGTTLTYTEVGAGVTTITVTANDGKGGTVSDEFTVTINAAPVNNPPTVANAITDKTEDEGFTSNTVDLSTVFSDADSDVLTYTASSSAEGVATVAVSGTALTYSEVSVGTTTITVTANDGKGGTVSNDFTVTINAAPVNNAPTVANAIADKTEDEGFTSNTVDLSTVFSDADSDVLTYTAISSTESVATVAVSGTTLTYSELSLGTTTITVTANDGKGGTVTDEFTVTINAAPVNNAPTVANTIADKTEDEGFASNTVDLSNVFADADSDALTYTAISSTESVATVAVSGTTLTYSEVSVGTTTITVTANDGKGGTVSDGFTVTINAAPVNNAPTLANAITDKTEDEGFTSNTVDLSNVFADADSDALTYTASSSEVGIATVSVAGTTLTYTEVAVGSTTITVTANDGKGGTVSDEFTVTINAAPVNNPPTVANAISDKTEDEGFTSNTVDLSNVFADADSDALTYTASSSIEGVATVALSGTTLTYTEVAVGATTITVTANDGKGGTVSDDFTVTINAAPVNNAPTLANAIADKTEDEGFTSNTVDLSNVFADADSDALTYTASSSTEGVATVAVSGTTLTYSEVSVGTTTITVTANDGKGGTVSDDFMVTINAAPVNNPPTVANPIADQTEIEGFRLLTIDLINVFTDVDEDALIFTALSSNTSIASVSVSGFNLDISEEATGTVTITVTAEDGRGGIATDEFSLSILEAAVPQEAEIPQGFSPNGDGVNDMWQVPNIENFPNNTVTIFDRQGNKVYQARGYNNADVSFEGLASSGAINKSQGLSDGVYYYIIDLGNGESRKGSIIIKQ